MNSKLVPKLEEEGFEYWIDKRNLVGGNLWNDDIDGAIKDAPALILVISERSMQSQFVTYEWCYALFHDVKIIPLRIQEDEQNGQIIYKIHPKLYDSQMCHFTQEEYYQWNNLTEALRQALNDFVDPAPQFSPAVINALDNCNSINSTERKMAIAFINTQIDQLEAVRAFQYICKGEYPFDVKVQSAINFARKTDYQSDEFVLQIANEMIDKWSSRFHSSEDFIEIDFVSRYRVMKAIPKLIDALNFYSQYFSDNSNRQLDEILRALDRFHTDDIRRNLTRYATAHLEYSDNPKFENVYLLQKILNEWNEFEPNDLTEGISDKES